MPVSRSYTLELTAVVVAAVATLGAFAAAPRQACPARPVPDASSPQQPLDTCIPDGFSEVAIDYFDDYSWRLFVGMVWPAAPDKRGVADTTKTLGDAGPRVFETYKSLWEVFHEDGTAPTANFNDYDTAAHNACKVNPQFGDIVLASSTAYGDVAQSGFGTLVGPLVAQNGRYVRYQTLYNQPAYDFIVANRYYLRSQLPAVTDAAASVPAMQFPDGSLAIKAAWLDMAGFTEAQTRRYYTRTAILKDPDKGTCSRVTVGLVGLHVVQKTPSRPQWSWSTYEHVDNVPPAQAEGPGTFTFHDGGACGDAGREPPVPRSARASTGEAVQRGPVRQDADSSQHGRDEHALSKTVERHGVGAVPTGDDAVVTRARQSGEPRCRDRHRGCLDHLSGRRRRIGLRERHLGDVRSRPRANGMHGMPLRRAHADGLHVVGPRPRVPGDHRPGALGGQREIRPGQVRSKKVEVRKFSCF